eukprot:gene15145-16702_t
MSVLRDITQLKVLMHRWGIFGRRFKIILFSICVMVAIWFSALKFSEHKNYFMKFQMKSKASVYCNKPKPVTGKDGNFGSISSQKYKLVQFQMVIRHGDRAPIDLDTLPNTEPVHIPCTIKTFRGDYEALFRFRRTSSMFKIHGNPSRQVMQERSECIGGQLTATGFTQHIGNGRYLRDAYSEFLDGVKRTSEILIKTTDYSRTVQSAAALLYGMFGESLKPEVFDINVHKDKYPETHFLADEHGEAIDCPVLRRKLRDVMKTDDLVKLSNEIAPIRGEFARLFKEDVSKIAAFNRLVDILYTRLCHDQTLPEGPNGAVSYSLAAKSFDLSHEFITRRHTPLAELQTLAIVSSIVQQAGKLIDGETNMHKIVMFSGHDTVLVPLLAVLGVHDGKWPPYASRIVFELWESKTNHNPGIAGSDLYQKFQGYYLRVIYNGKPLTGKVKFCIGKTVEGGELCPLSEFVKFVTSNEFNGLNYFERIRNICTVS